MTIENRSEKWKIPVISTIKLIKEKEDDILYIIAKTSLDEEKDYLCRKSFLKKTLSDQEIDSIEIGTKVKFSVMVTDSGAYIAQNVTLISSDDIAVDYLDDWFKDISEVRELVHSTVYLLKSAVDKINDADQFEKFTTLILKYLGISEIYPIQREHSAGRCDGIFKCANISNNESKLEVFYDCTLNSNWEEFKKEQQSNYISQIIKSQIAIPYTYRDEFNKKNNKKSLFK